MPHLLGIILIKIAVADEPAKDSLANQHLHPLGIGVCEHRLPEPNRLIASLLRLEYAVDDTTMKVQVLIERRAKTVHEAHCPQS